MPRYESRWGGFVEIEVVDADVVELHGSTAEDARIGKPRSKTHPSPDEAGYAAATQIAKLRKRGYKPVGPARHLGAAGGPAAPVLPPAAGSAIALDAFFAAGDPQFLPELVRSTAAGKLAALAERWYADGRPWARAPLVDYILDGCDRPLHKGLVKRLYKLAEAAGDDELLARFMVAFDRLSRRFLVEERAGELVWKQDPSRPARFGTVVKQGQDVSLDEDPQFSKATRRYLQRRVNRYFRVLAHRDVARYGRAMRLALPLYQDAHVASVAMLLDSWSLVHALYGRSPVLVRAPNGIRVADGKCLADLAPAPHFDAAWQGGFADLLAMVTAAGSRTVRGWAIAMLRVRHAAELAALPFAEVKRLVTSEHDEAIVLGAELLAALRGLETLPLADWLDLLAIQNLDVLPAIAQLAQKLLAPARLSLAQCIELASGKTAPVAVLGLAWAKTKPIKTAADLAAIARLVRAGVAIVRDDGARWALGVIAAHPATGVEHVRDLCDAPFADARKHALAVAAADEKFAAQPALWLALAESPYPDVRAVVVAHAARWRDQAPVATLRHVWATAILALYGGAAVKARVPRQIAERIAAHPDEAAELLPVLGYALRSVRPAERALALGALARAARANPALAHQAHQALPELTLSAQVSA
jgi:hypothetical protein